MSCKTVHRGKYYVSIKKGFEDSKRDVSLFIEKVYETDALKISLSDDEDPTFLCVVTITRMDYEDLKKQQGLLVDFDNFPSQLIRLLQQCASNNMFLIMQQKNPVQYYFEVVEHNEFKRLVHLSLKTGPATDSEIKQHMADNIMNLKRTLASVKSCAISTEAILNDKCMNLERKLHDFTHNITRMEEEKMKLEIEYKESINQERERLMQDKQLWQQNAEHTMNTQLSSYQDRLNKKDIEIAEMNSLCKQLKDNMGVLENQLSEKMQCLNLLEKEVQKSHIEVATLKAKNASLERDYMEKDKLYNQINAKCIYLEKTIKDDSDAKRDLNNTIQILKKEKQSLEERMALSESLVNKNNEAVQSTSEQLLKANQIISKQNADLIEMKEKLLCRTAIALEQEKVIEGSTKEMEELKEQLRYINQNMDKLQKEFDDLKEKYEANENALKERDETIKNNNMVIQWLHKKMDHIELSESVQNKHGIPVASSSTPYFLSRNNNHTDSLHGISEESIDFYGTSKSSNIEATLSPESQDKSKKVGLDPKYLQPVDNDSKVVKITDAKSKSSNQQRQKGKENINLPKVNYREKKSTRASTYRATPVSAYFP